VAHHLAVQGDRVEKVAEEEKSFY